MIDRDYLLLYLDLSYITDYYFSIYNMSCIHTHIEKYNNFIKNNIYFCIWYITNYKTILLKI